jgi:hypothetical protein
MLWVRRMLRLGFVQKFDGEKCILHNYASVARIAMSKRLHRDSVGQQVGMQ